MILYEKELMVKAVIEELDCVLNLVRQGVSQTGGDEGIGLCVEMIAEEIYTNIASYAYPDVTKEARIICKVTDDPLTMTVIFEDWGIPYNPLLKEDPDITASVEDRPIGGLGIFMTKKMMDDVSYEYKDGRNRLTIRKNIASKQDV